MIAHASGICPRCGWSLTCNCTSDAFYESILAQCDHFIEDLRAAVKVIAAFNAFGRGCPGPHPIIVRRAAAPPSTTAPSPIGRWRARALRLA